MVIPTKVHLLQRTQPLATGYLILFPKCQLLLRLLQLLGPVHHKVDEVDAPGQREEHQDVGNDSQADSHRPAERSSTRMQTVGLGARGLSPAGVSLLPLPLISRFLRDQQSFKFGQTAAWN